MVHIGAASVVFCTLSHELVAGNLHGQLAGYCIQWQKISREMAFVRGVLLLKAN